MKTERDYSPHLQMEEGTVPAGGEWAPGSRGWTVLYLKEGAGYWVQPAETRAWHAGSVLVLSRQAQGYLLASQLGGLKLDYFTVQLERLAGLLNLQELHFLEAAAQGKFAVIVLPSNHGVAARFREMAALRKGQGLPGRLGMLQMFMDIFADDWPVATPISHRANARERLRAVLNQTTAAELLALTPGELARKADCTPRHLTRVFQEVVGISFSEKRTELRMAHAVELLANSQGKVVDVAMESGYQSLSLFNFHFKRRYGVSPTQWRDQFAARKAARVRRRADQVILV